MSILRRRWNIESQIVSPSDLATFYIQNGSESIINPFARLVDGFNNVVNKAKLLHKSYYIYAERSDICSAMIAPEKIEDIKDILVWSNAKPDYYGNMVLTCDMYSKWNKFYKVQFEQYLKMLRHYTPSCDKTYFVYDKNDQWYGKGFRSKKRESLDHVGSGICMDIPFDIYADDYGQCLLINFFGTNDFVKFGTYSPWDINVLYAVQEYGYYEYHVETGERTRYYIVYRGKKLYYNVFSNKMEPFDLANDSRIVLQGR